MKKALLCGDCCNRNQAIILVVLVLLGNPRAFAKILKRDEKRLNGVACLLLRRDLVILRCQEQQQTLKYIILQYVSILADLQKGLLASG